MAYRISQPLAETQFDDDKPKKEKLKKKDRKKLTEATSSGKAADYKYTLPVRGSVKGDAMTVKEKEYKGELTTTQKKRISRIEKSDKNKEKRNPNFKSNKAKFKKDKLIAKNKEKARKNKQKEKDKATWANATPAEKEAMNTQQKRNRKNKLKDFAKKLGIAKKDSQTGSKNRKARVDPNCGGKIGNAIATKKSCKKPQNK